MGGSQLLCEGAEPPVGVTLAGGSQRPVGGLGYVEQMLGMTAGQCRRPAPTGEAPRRVGPHGCQHPETRPLPGGVDDQQ